MNRQATADELDRQVEKLLQGTGQRSDPLVMLAAELRMLPDPEFKGRLKDQLREEWDDGFAASSEDTHPWKAPKGGAPSLVVAQAARVETFERSPGLSLAGMAPLFSGKHTGLFAADHRSFLVSFASHAALIALIASGIFVGRVTIVKSPSLTSELMYPLPGKGGGGSGDRSAIQATRGTPPKFSEHQLSPPAIVVHSDPLLPVPPTVLGSPEIRLPQSNHIGDLVSSNTMMPSNGTGAGGAAGDGKGTGLGAGNGGGVGLGSDAGIGGGHYNLPKSITAPRAIYDPEPEYSEEARHIKYQGTVVLALVVDPQGRARDIHVARSLGMGLDEKAVEAVKNWRFTPGTQNGSPVAMQVDVEVTFRLY